MGKSFLKNNTGMSLIEIMISMGILSIMMFSFMSMMQSQQKEAKALSEVIATLDLQKTVISALSDGSVCKYVLNNPAPITFNALALPQTVTPSLPVYSNVNGGIPSLPLVKVGDAISPYSSTMIVKSIEFEITSGSGSDFMGQWVIKFDETKSVRSHKPVYVSALIKVDSSVPTASKIYDCMLSGSLAALAGKTCGTTQIMAGFNADGTIKCQAPSTAATNCAAGQFIGGFNPDGSIKCQTPTAAAAGCAAGQLMAGFNPDGSIKCQAPTIAATGCAAGQFIAGFNPDGSINCAAPPAATAATGGGKSSGCASGHMSLGGYICDTFSGP